MADNGKNGAMRIDTKLVRELAELLDESNLTEIEVEDGERKIKVKRDSGGSGGGLTPAQIAAFNMFRDTPAVPPAPMPAGASDGGAAAEPKLDGTLVKSPMVGTAYLSPEPGAKPFASVGDAVKAGDTLMIIEAMKVMNPITAPAAGKIKQYLIGDAQPVEFDQPLVVIG